MNHTSPPLGTGEHPPLSRWVWAIALFYLFLQVLPLLLGGYGLFIDELYYLACASRLQLGYVDHPPLAPLILRGLVSVFGESQAAIRLPAALVGSLLVVGTGWFAARWGGGRFAQALAATGICFAPLPLIAGSFFSMNVFEPLIWAAMIAIVVEMIRRNDPRWWLLFGALAGLGLEMKHTVVLLGAAVVAALVFEPSRRLLFTPWLAAGGLLAAVLLAPNLWWQIQNDWISLEFYRGQSVKNLPTSPATVLFNQLLVFNPGAGPIWIAGLGVSLWSVRFRYLRFASVAYLLLLGSMVWMELSRPDRIAGLYPPLFAAGAIAWESWSAGRRKLRVMLLALPVAVGVVLLPISLPLLPPAPTAAWAASLGVVPQLERGEGKRSELPQWLADRFGWEQFVDDVRLAYAGLGPEEQRSASVLVPSYGHAGALELASRNGGALPPVFSHHNNYFLWGRADLGRLESGPLIAVGVSRDDLAGLYRDVQLVGRHRCSYCMAWRRDYPIYVARQPLRSKAELQRLWEVGRNLQ